MPDQLQFALKKPGVDLAGRRADLVAVLRGRGWVTARKLRALGFTDRELREIAELDDSAEILSVPGSPGYRLFDESAVCEISRAISLRNQGRKMLRRWVRYQRRLHRFPRP